jgi:hypothetical protein
MTGLRKASTDGSDASSPGVPAKRGPLLRWFVSSATLGVPQAAGPVAFSLVALGLVGHASGGAAMMLAMTLAQVIGAIPIARLGRRVALATYLRMLVAVRTAALMAVAVLAACEASFTWLVVLAAVAGSVNGAASGYVRAILNHLVSGSRMPRALGIAATLNETTFVLAPVAAAGLGTISPAFAVFALAVLGAVPALLVPNTGAAHADPARGASASLLTGPILLWLGCAGAGGAVVAAIEIGAVSLALNFGYEPTLAILFTVPLCLASVSGGIWVSVRNRMATRKAVLAQLLLMAFGSALAALNLSVATTVVATVLIGVVLAPLSTYNSLVHDGLAPPQRRAELFALLRTANATGVIFASAVLTAVSLSLALVVVCGLMIVATLVVGIVSVRSRAFSSDPRPGVATLPDSTS